MHTVAELLGTSAITSHGSIVRALLMVGAFWALPALVRWTDTTGTMAGIIGLLLVGFPLIVAVFSFMSGLRHGMSIAWLVVAPLGFLSTLFVYYNESASIYILVYGVIGLVLSALGALVRSALNTTRS